MSLETKVWALAKTVSDLSQQLSELIRLQKRHEKGNKDRQTATGRTINKLKKKSENSI